MKDTSNSSVPSAYNLKELHLFVTGKVFDNAHRALEDIKAPATVLIHPPFWDCLKDDIWKVTQLDNNGNNDEDQPAAASNDVDDSSDEGSISGSLS